MKSRNEQNDSIYPERMSPEEAASYRRQDMRSAETSPVRNTSRDMANQQKPNPKSSLNWIGKLFIVILGLIYILSPIDFIPDFLIVIGWLDDLGVLAIILPALISLIRNKPPSKGND